VDPFETHNYWRLSALVGMTPFMEQQAIWEQISNPNEERSDGVVHSTVSVDGLPWPPMGPTPSQIQYVPWTTEIPTLRCPSDPGVGLPALGRSNYAVCFGDSMRFTLQGSHRPQLAPSLPANRAYALTSRVANRGMFVTRTEMKFRDVLDGLSNTVAMGEIATDLGDKDSRTIAAGPGPSGRSNPGLILNNPRYCIENPLPFLDPARPRFWDAGLRTDNVIRGRGYAWADGNTIHTGFNSINPPNSPLCIGNGVNGISMFSASSRHQGGAHVLMGDGAVVFITDSIEAGDQNASNVHRGGTAALGNTPGSKSPYGLWGALGTRASSETIEEQLNQ
jgi:prepilin-type processing-associated H-X9-DG protein